MFNFLMDDNNIFFELSSFGSLNLSLFTKKEEGKKTIYCYNNNDIQIISEFEHFEHGVIIRRDFVKNNSDKDITLNNISSCYTLEGVDYDIYTQTNGWQNESNGLWQHLHGMLKICNLGIRTCEGFTPMMAIKNNQNNKCYVFHLIPNCQWKMNVYQKAIIDKSKITILETGFDDKCLSLTIKAGDSISLPEVIFYEVENLIDFDCYKLHSIYNSLYPRNQMPVIYNSWLFNFDQFTVDEIFEQIDECSELGIEYFVIDAGWFGKRGEWREQVGNWEECVNSCTEGKLNQIADKVHKNGMKFGLWFEPERTGKDGNLLKEHPEYYINNEFFDFSNEKARKLMVKIIANQIDKYSIDFIKFDFNSSLDFDQSGNGFYYYLQGQKKFIEELKEMYPSIYISNCASGGQRMELGQSRMCDSFWPSDNQGQISGLRIIKDTLKRLPSSVIERWNVQSVLGGVPLYGSQKRRDLIVTCGNATWDVIESVSLDYTLNFLTGGPIGFSFDLKKMPIEYKAAIKEYIKEYKKNREFYLTANVHILCDTDNFICLEYSNNDYSKNIILLFSKIVYQDYITIYPRLNKNYQYDNNYIEKGIRFNNLKDNDCKKIIVEKIN